MKRRKPSLDNSQSNKRQKKNDDFNGLLSRYGFEFGESYAVKDPAILQASLEKKLRNEDIKKSFVEGFEKHIDDQQSLRRSLRNTRQIEDLNVSTSQPSLARILLGIQSIQKEVLESLFMQIVECSEDESNPVHKLILRNMRWLENVFDIEWLTEKLKEVLGCLSLEKQKDLLGVLPEIITDQSQDSLTETLMETLEENKDLTVHILDCLSNMIISDDKLTTAQTTVLGLLKAVDMDAIPVLLKFLCRTCAKGSVKKIFDGIRAALDPETVGGDESGFVLTALHNAVRQRTLLCPEFTNLLSQQKEHSSFDLWLWFCLSSVKNHKDRVIRKLIAKVKKGTVDFKLVEYAIAPHREAMEGLFDTLVEICEALVRNLETKEFGKKFYVLLFKVFDDKHRQQELVFKQIVHIGSQKSHEIDMALGALQDFMEHDEKVMKGFVTLIKQLLDYVHYLDLSQLRMFYTIYVQLSIDIDVCTGDVNTDPNFEILIQKQLSHANPDIQKMGVVGKLKILSRLSREMENEEIYDNVKETAFHILDALINKSTMMRSNMRAFTYNEINVVIRFDKLQDILVEKILGSLQNSFEEFFFGSTDITEVELPLLKRFDVEPKFWYDLDQDDAQVSVRVATTVCTPERASFIEILCPLWDLVVTLHWTTKQSLEDLDAVLGCPLQMFDENIIIEGTIMAYDHKTRRLLMDSVVVAINWIRGVINAFSSREDKEVQSDKDYSRKLHSRLRNLIELESHLENMLLYTPEYTPSWLNIQRNPFRKLKKSKRKKPPKRKKKKKKKKKNEDGDAVGNGDEEDEEEEDVAIEVSPQKVKPKGNTEKKLEKLRCHFVEFQPTVFERLLAHDISTNLKDPEDDKLSIDVLARIVSEWKRIIDLFCVNVSWFSSSSSETISTFLSHYNEKSLLNELAMSFHFVRKHLVDLMRFTSNDDLDDEQVKDFVGANFPMIVNIMQMIFDVCIKLLKCRNLKNTEELRLAFAYLTYEEQDDAKSAAGADVFESLFNDLKIYLENQENMTVITSIVNILDKLPAFCGSRKQMLRLELQKSCEKLLKKTFEEEGIFVWKSSNLGVIVACLIQSALDSVKQMSTIMEYMLDIEASPFQSTLTKANLGIYFDSILPILSKQLYSIRVEREEGLEEVLKVAKVFKMGSQVVLKYADVKNTGTSLQITFLKEGGKLLDFLARRNFVAECTDLKDDDTVQILNVGKSVTKIIHRICQEAKAMQEQKLINLIPEATKSCQRFSYEVKNLFASKGHIEAIQFGALKKVGISGANLDADEDEDEEMEEDGQEEELVDPESDADDNDADRTDSDANEDEE